MGRLDEVSDMKYLKRVWFAVFCVIAGPFAGVVGAFECLCGHHDDQAWNPFK